MVTVCPSQFATRRTLFHVLVGCGLLMLKVSRLKHQQATTNQNVKKRPACSELRWAYCNHKATYFASYLTGGDCVCRMTFPILASLLVRLVVLLPFQLLRLSLATPSRWTPLALSVFLHCVVALLLTLL